MAAKKSAVLSNKFELVGETSLDAKERVSLSEAIASNGTSPKKRGTKKAGSHFIIHRNDAGQILLTPQVIHPEEAWLYENPKAMASVRRGLKQLAGGKRYDLGSFAQYADDEID